MKTTFRIILVCVLSFFNLSAQSDISNRIKHVISQMTLEEKINQMNADSNKAIPRLGIRDYKWHNECLHGVIAPGATVFPQVIGLAATFDRSMVHEVAAAISDEARILYNRGVSGLHLWSPNINICRDPRWGRAQETYGEDPYLTSVLGVEFIRGMQEGNDPKFLKTVVAPKHYIVHSGPEGGRHSFNAKVNSKDLYDTYMPAFKAAVVDGKVGSMLASFNAINGVPAIANRFLLTEVLRNQWGFDGFVVSDCGGIGFVYWAHGYGSTPAEGVANAINAGMDQECGYSLPENLFKAVQDGLIEESIIDSSLTRLFKSQFRLGIYDAADDCSYSLIPDSLLNSQKHKEIAKAAVAKSIVLLKNEGAVLPLKKQQKILLTGPNSDMFWNLLGNYSIWKDWGDNVYDVFRKKIEHDSLLTFFRTSEIEAITAPLTESDVKTLTGEPGFYAEYFNNCTLSGEPVLTRIDKSIDFEWGQGSPYFGIKSDSFSVRWTGVIKVNEKDNYTFRLVTDDGSRLYVDDVLMIDKWYPEFATGTKHNVMTLEPGREYKIRVEYFDYCYNASARFEFGGENTRNPRMENKAVELAKENDVIVFVGGITSLYESEDTGMQSKYYWHGDRKTIELPKVQTEMLKVLKQSGKPVVLVLVNGACMAMNWAKDSVDAIVETWYGGEQGAEGIADVLFGDFNPAGRLPVTFYKSDEDLPDFSDYSMRNRTYRFFKDEVLFPFGHGLSYTQFEYGEPSINKTKFKNEASDSIYVEFKVKNIGTINGDEVPQIYLSKQDPQNYNAIKQLIEFSRVNLDPDADTVLGFKFSPNDFICYDTLLNKYVVENGNYTMHIGSSSQDIKYIIDFEISADTTVSVENIEKQIRVFPTPSQNSVNIAIPYSLDCGIVPELYTVYGDRISIEYVESFNTFTLDTKSLSSGVYMLRLGNLYSKLITIVK